ncbi:hypothetical protein M0R04_01365 [Candidatus Dojkabacteria bacterium]|jgi:hypothetical protein|nr:hypothetical protein [Candidatus Dojkabacteria bacterium]
MAPLGATPQTHQPTEGEVLFEQMYERGREKANELFQTDNLTYTGFGIFYAQRQMDVQIRTEGKYKLGFYEFQEEGVYSLPQDVSDEISKLGDKFKDSQVFGIVSTPLDKKSDIKHGVPTHHTKSVLVIDAEGNYWILETGTAKDSMFFRAEQDTDSHIYQLTSEFSGKAKMRHISPTDTMVLQSATIWHFNPTAFPKNIQDQYAPSILKGNNSKFKAFVAKRGFLDWPKW